MRDRGGQAEPLGHRHRHAAVEDGAVLAAVAQLGRRTALLSVVESLICASTLDTAAP
ncbi:conserved hypothetical protein, partial [Ricinus communis]